MTLVKTPGTEKFGLMRQITDQNHNLHILKQRGKGYYHDIYDKPAELTLNHVAGVAQLLIDFVREVK